MRPVGHPMTRACPTLPTCRPQRAFAAVFRLGVWMAVGCGRSPDVPQSSTLGSTVAPPDAVADAPASQGAPGEGTATTPEGAVVATCASGAAPATGCFVAVPAGTVVYGAQSADPGAPGWDPDALPDEGPTEVVQVAAFWMQNSEAPWWQWERCVSAGGCAFPAGAAVGAPASREFPLASLTFDEAAAFCRFLGGRLPTQREWEHAAKAGDDRRFPWGDIARCPSSSPEEEESIVIAREALVRRCDDLVSLVFRDGSHDQLDLMGLVLTTWDAARMDAACAAAHAAPDPYKAFLEQLDLGWKDAVAAPARRKCFQSAAYEVGWMRTDHPWGLLGLGGNVMEWTVDQVGVGRHAVRGGSFLAEDVRGWRTSARASLPDGLRAADVGVRCVRDVAP